MTDTCLLRIANSAENCTPGHDCAECEHYEPDDGQDLKHPEVEK